MNSIMYMVSIIVSVCSILLPGGMAILFISSPGMLTGVLTGVLVFLSILLQAPIQKMRVHYRNIIDYDEFGRSKRKGRYEYLSKKEKDQIDLQKTLDMERVLNTSVLKKMTKKGSEDPDNDMEDLVGLQPVKQKMREMVARMQFDRQERKALSSMSGRHMVFYGSPGTGKTTVARILTGFLYRYDYIKKNKCVEVDGNFLKAGTPGDTALKTELIIQQAYDGVLFIDEAYALLDSGDGCGKEAVATLIKQMEDHRDRFILILAGYTKNMQQLLNANPGFESRIQEYLNFPDYQMEELKEIFTYMAWEQNFYVDASALDAFEERMEKERKLSSFGNARTVRNLLDEAIGKHALNCMNGDSKDRYRLTDRDVNRNLQRKGMY